jgi:REP element-mobilizing transposase RayT
MVIGYHLIITAYAWWLPNDPRGSTSHTIECDVLKELGELHFGRKKIQPPGGEIRAFYERADDLLKFDLLTFDDITAQVMADAFAQCIRDNHYTCWAGVIMRDHTHLCLRKHEHLAEEMIENFSLYSRRALIDAGLRPNGHPVWGSGGWKVFLGSPDDVKRTIHYIEQNPVKQHRPIQHYPWIRPYNNWPYHNRLRFSNP